MEKEDLSTKPLYYNQGEVEFIKAIRAATTYLSGEEAFCTGNVIKYMWRWRQKGGKEDLLKAKNYIDILIKDFY